MRVYGGRRPSRWTFVRRWVAAALLVAAAGYGVRAIADHTSVGRAQTTTGTASGRAGTITTQDAVKPASTSDSGQPPAGPSAPPGQGVPILMYHVIESPPASAPYPDLYLPPALFQSQIRYLHGHGYHAVTLDQVWQYWHDGKRLPIHPIVLSFDDGYLSQYSVAARFLARYDWPGVLNLAVKHLYEGSYGLTAGRVDKMIAAGWEIDSHTINHVDVTTLDSANLTREVAGSRTILERMFHQPVDFFCYPTGAYDATAIKAVRAAGYLGATTTNEGLASPHQDPYELGRVRVPGTETATQLAQTLRSFG